MSLADLAAGERRRTQLAQQHAWCERQAGRRARPPAAVADLPQASREELVEVATLFAGRLPGWEGPQSTDPWTLAVDADGGEWLRAAVGVFASFAPPVVLFLLVFDARHATCIDAAKAFFSAFGAGFDNIADRQTNPRRPDCRPSGRCPE